MRPVSVQRLVSIQSLVSIRASALLLTLCLGCSGAPELPRFPEPTSALRPETQRGIVPADARITDYELEGRLDAEQHRVEGSARVTWRNTTQRTVDSLPFHLYLNGFRAEDTAWMRTSGGAHRNHPQNSEGTWGYIDIHSVQLEASPLFVADDTEDPRTAVDLPWREDDEPSTMTVDLPRPVGPGETITVHLGFTAQLPRVIARTGYLDEFHAVAQWFPKLGVLEDEAGWQAHTFTVQDEFYADFGNYKVMLDVPERMVVGATGVRTAEEIVDGRKRLTYEAEMVHDFAWMADPNFVEHHGEWQGIRIRQLIQPEHIADADAHLAATVSAFESYQKRFGPYPWSSLTIIHAPEGAEDAGGMEYPTLFTTSDMAPLPPWVRNHLFDEKMSGLFTTLHEFGHQYFQGLFASREHLEPWLDEGMNTTSNLLAAIDRAGSEDPVVIRLLSQEILLSDSLSNGIARRGFLEPLDRPASAFRRIVRNYGSTVYMRTAALMLTLRNVAGHEAFDRALRIYSDEARFRHPRGSELEATLVAGLGERPNVAAAGSAPVHLDVQEYLDQALRTTHEIDFEVYSIDNRPLRGKTGWHRDDNGTLQGGEPPPYLDKKLDELGDAVEGRVAVRRAGAFQIPVDIRVVFEDGSSETLTWDNQETIGVFSWPGQKIHQVTLDPEHKLLLEWDRLDNMAYDPDLGEEDGLSRPLGDLTEAMSLAVMGLGL